MTLKELFTVYVRGAQIKVYEDEVGIVVLGGLGWMEKLAWEEIEREAED